MTKPDREVPRASHHRVQQLRVVGGFLADAKLDFADGLNCLIGGRGTGKTTALEFLRFGLGLMPDTRTDAKRHRAIEDLVKANLGEGRLSIEVLTRNGMRYTASRSAAESVQVVNEAGAAVPVSLDRDMIFGADVFSQNEIEEIASSPAAQLSLLDRFSEGESSAVARELEALHRQLDQSAGDLATLDDEIEDLRAKASELPVLEEKLKGLTPAAGPGSQKIAAAHTAKAARTREAQVVEGLGSFAQKAVREVGAAAGALQSVVAAQLDKTLSQGANREVFEPLRKDADAFASAVAAAAESVAAAGRTLEARLREHGGALATRHAAQEAEYRTLVSASKEEDGRASERAALQASHAAATAAAKAVEAKQADRKRLITARAESLRAMSELRDRRFAARKAVAERLTRQLTAIRVTVTQSSDTTAYRELVTEALKGSRVQQGPTAERLCQVFLPTELALLVQAGDHASIVRETNFDEPRARKVVDALSARGASYAIEAAELQDRPCIELRDGAEFKESPHLSTGQRCTTILPILLVQSERPLLIDQPEDNLDNAFIYETVVKALLQVKGSRQVIVVTHNPNIPVLGRAERVFVFSSDGQHATLRKVGTVDECKDEIETILEGGREAFLERKTRYGH